MALKNVFAFQSILCISYEEDVGIGSDWNKVAAINHPQVSELFA